MPKLRFPGFEGEWKTIILSDFAEQVTRKNVNNESNLPLTISSKDGLVDQISYFNKAIASRDMSGYYLLQNGEFAYNKSYSVGYDFGSIKRLDKYPKGALSTLYICFALKKYDSDFIKIYFDSLKWYREICMIAAEGARNHGLLNVSADAFFATKHILPQNKKEQEKIAAFMILLEKRVVLQQQLLDALKLYKRGALSRLFPKNGSSVPEYRFAGFTSDWEQRKLGEICSTFLDGDWIESKDQSESGVRLIQTGNIGIGTYLDKFERAKWISEDTFNRLHCEEVYVGDILISRLPDPAGRACIIPATKEKMITAVDVTIARTSDDFDSKFVLQYLCSDSYFKDVSNTLSGSTRQRISRSSLEKIAIPIASRMQEQKKIGIFFSQLDTLITLHQKKVEQYTNLKRSMLEKLFI